MELLKQKIIAEGEVLPGDILKIDSFLNQQIDPETTYAMGKEICRIFSDVKIDKVVTIEASGIAIGLVTAHELGVKMVFGRKNKSNVMVDDVYVADVYSYTKQVTNHISISKKFLEAGENVLIVDDFLANGSAALGLCNIVEQAGGKVVGISVAVEKAFQDGEAKLVEAGYRVEPLVRIKSLKDGKVTFVED